MSMFAKITSGFVLAMMFGVSIGTAEAGTCGRFGGWGIGVTQAIASFMSEKATHQALDKENAKPVSAIHTVCNTDALLYVQCHSTTKGCSR